MKNIILCSSNPILVKSLYGILRDEGHNVETIEHPAFAVQTIIRKQYDFIIFDSEPFGLSAEDAAKIINWLAPDVRVMFIGTERAGDPFSIDGAVDLEEFKKTIHSIAV